MESVQRAGGLGRHDANGRYADLLITGLEDREQADEFRRSLFRCAHFLNRRGIAAVSMSADPPARQPDGSYVISFRAIDKTAGRAYILAKHGGDRTRWPYDPRRRNAS